MLRPLVKLILLRMPFRCLLHLSIVLVRMAIIYLMQIIKRKKMVLELVEEEEINLLLLH